MSKKCFIFTILFFTALILISKQTMAETITQGILDLAELPMTGKIMTLEGEWEFYWEQLATAENFQENSHPLLHKNWIEAPAIWANAKYSGNHQLTNKGYGTYRLIIKLHEADQKKVFSLYIPPVASAFLLFVDGVPLANNGIVGRDRNSMEPKAFSQVVSFFPKSEEIEIIMQVSNFSQRKGGIWSPLKFGLSKEVSGQRELTIIKEIIVASSLFALGIYHFSLYFFQVTTILPLFLGGFCLLVSLRVFLVGELLLVNLFPDFPWELGVKLEYLTFYIGLMIVFSFLAYLFPKEINRTVSMCSITICLVFSLTTMLPAYIFTHFIFVFELFLAIIFPFYFAAIILTTIRKREGAWISFLSIIVLVAAIINDIFYYHFGLQSIELAPIAAFAVLFIYTLTIAQKSSHAFKQAKQLSQELREMNASLEQIVDERTKDLQEKNTQLQHIEKTRKSFFSSVAHEIGTPLQAIQGYVQLLQEQKHSKEEKSYLNVIDEKARLLRHLSKDLLDLAKMDEGHFEFILEETNASYLVNYLINRFKYDIERVGLSFHYATPQRIPKGWVLLINIDIIRIEQVTTNLIHNALKFTPEKGIVKLKGEYVPLAESTFSHTGLFQLEISDTGIGIEKELLPFIFERFIKGTASINQGRGSGLGLAISKEIIQKHDGTIVAESQLGKGSRFIIQLPAQLCREDDLDEVDHSNY